MGTPAPGTVLLFVGGDPSVAERLVSYPIPVGGMRRAFLPTDIFPRGRRSSPPPDGSVAPERPWLVPVGQLRCVELLDEAAQRAGRQIRLIDVNRPGDADRPLVMEWVGPADDVLPILVRSDGARLVGQESFSPSALREFLSHP